MMKARIVEISLAFGLSCLCCSAFAAPPATPSDFVFSASTAADLGTLTWTDNSADEDEFVLEFKRDGGAFVEIGFRPVANATTVTFNGFVPGTAVTLRLRASNADGFSDYSEEATIVTIGTLIVDSSVTVTPGGDFAKQMSLSRPGSLTLTSIPPAWMSWDDTALILSGTDAPAGIVALNFSAVAGPHSRTRTFYVQVNNEPPVATGADTSIGAVVAPRVVDLGPFFRDQDMGRAAEMTTPIGPIRVGLYDDATTGAPGTVANFFAYADSGRWDGTFFHRSVSQFVIQGGGYKPVAGAAEGQFGNVEDFDPIVNEYDSGRPNICGTIAMAKLGGNPDSATSEFFFSLKDNVTILDPQNGGFTVFGRAIDMGVIDQIGAFDTGTYAPDFDGVPRSFTDWPLSAVTEDSPLVSQLASISGVVEISTLSYAVSGGEESIAMASVIGTGLNVVPASIGQTEFTVTATDLDGGSVAQQVSVTVGGDYADWAAASGAGAADANDDGGLLNNLQEYAFGGDPLTAGDDESSLPVLTTFENAYDAVTFRQRRFASDLEYKVQSSTDLIDWTELWTEENLNDVFAAAEVGDEFSTLTIRRIEPMSNGGERFFFRVVVSLTVPD